MRIPTILVRAVSAWPLAVKSGFANRRLLSSVVIGVLLASAVTSGTVIYFDSLRELALGAELANYDALDLNVLVKTTKGPTNREEYEGVRRIVEGGYEPGLGWLLDGAARGGRSATFFVTAPGSEANAGTDNARGYFQFLEDAESHIRILPGGAPPAPLLDFAPDGRPLQVEGLIPADSADALGVGVGDSLSLIPHWRDDTPYAAALITGVYERRDPDAAIWRFNDVILHTFTRGNFKTAPIMVSEDTLLGGVGSAFAEMDSNYGWALNVDAERLNSSNAVRARRGVEALDVSMSSVFQSYRQVTLLDEALAVYDRRLLFTRLQMFVAMTLIAGVALYCVAALSSLAAEQRGGEIALLRARGASERQALAALAMEGATITALATALAPFLAAAAVSLLGFAPAFSELGGGSLLPVRLTRAAFAMSAVGGALSFGALMIPAYAASRASPSESRRESARPSRLSFVQRYYLDVALLALGVIMFRRLAERGSAAASNLLGEAAANQISLAVPAITLAAAAMVSLRLFPLAMSLASRLTSSRLPPGLSVGLRQMSRNPTHYARLALLLMLMSGLGVFAAGFGGTLERNFSERVLYAAGADIRLSGVSLNNRGTSRPFIEAYESADGVESAAAALRANGSHLSTRVGDSTLDILAVDSERFAETAWFRDDFAGEPLADLMARLRPAGEIPLGAPLPQNARTLRILLKPDRPRPDVVLTARLRDDNGRYLTYWLGALESDEWTMYEARLFDPRLLRRALFPSRPLTLASIAIIGTDADLGLRAGSMLIDSVEAGLSDGSTAVLEDYADAGRWSVMRDARDAARDKARPANASARGDGSLMFAWESGRSRVARGLLAGDEPKPVPIVASASFFRKFRHSIGDEPEISISGRRVNAVLVGETDFFPTMDGYKDRFAIADLDTLLATVNPVLTRGEVTPNEVWIKTALNGAERARLIERFEDGRPFPVGRIIDVEADLRATRFDPLALAGWRALLLTAFGAMLILSAVGFWVHAYVSFRNRESQFALMRTMGFSARQLASLMLLEQALVAAAGMALGGWMGGRLGAAVMPFLGYDDAGSRALPPFVIEVAWQNLIYAYGAMSLVFAAVIAVVIWLIRRIALSRALRLGDG